jgi:anti-sigma regulatory factor (Ser/Thr protein kinase)
VRCDFDDQLTELAEARRFTERVLGSEHERLDTALVVVSELTSNALRHAKSGFTLSVDEDEHHVRIEVIDRGGGWPVPVEVRAPPTSGGMGLYLVEALADRWGAVERPPGKLVWAEIDEAQSGNGARS